MKDASNYRQNAEQCRAIARTLSDATQRQQLLSMAEAWDDLAAERESSKHAQQPALVADPDDAKGG